jgi:hypothetical protein
VLIDARLLEFVRAEFLDLPCHLRLPICSPLLETRGELSVGPRRLQAARGS